VRRAVNGEERTYRVYGGRPTFEEKALEKKRRRGKRYFLCRVLPKGTGGA